MSKNTVVIFGKKYIPDGRVKRLLRKSPKANDRAKAIGKCARGKNLAERKKCFETGGKESGSKPKPAKPKLTLSAEDRYKKETGKSAIRGKGRSAEFKEWLK